MACYVVFSFLIKCKKLDRSKVKQSWKPASQNIQAYTNKQAKGTGSLEQKKQCSTTNVLNKTIKTT
jgi:hypothetical protein